MNSTVKNSYKNASNFSFVCCIEAGRLEHQTCLMVSTFRKNAGEELKDSLIYAISGRTGPKLSEETKQFLKNHNVEIINAYTYNPKPWFNYSNKIAAVSWAQENLHSKYLGWLDSDILIAGDFTKNLPSEFDFVGRCDSHSPVITENDQKYLKYWMKLCQIINCNYDDIPWIYLEEANKKVKLYFNSGFFVWRKKSNFANLYRLNFIKLIDSKVATIDGSAWFADQVIISPIIISSKLKWHHLNTLDHHMVFSGHITGVDAAASMNNSNLIHYSKSLSNPNKLKMMNRLKLENKKIFDDINEFENKFPQKIHNKKIFNLKIIYRKLKTIIFMKTLKNF